MCVIFDEVFDAFIVDLQLSTKMNIHYPIIEKKHVVLFYYCFYLQKKVQIFKQTIMYFHEELSDYIHFLRKITKKCVFLN